MGAAYLILFFSLLPTGIAYHLFREIVQAHDQARFDEIVRQTQDDIDRRINRYLDVLLSVQGLFADDQNVQPNEWRKYFQTVDLTTRFPGLDGIAFAKRVRGAAERMDLEQKLRRLPNFSNAAITPPPTGEESFPVLYLAPMNPARQQMLGYDISSAPVQLAAMEQARDTGQPAASAMANLPPYLGQTNQPGFSIFLPVYHVDIQHRTMTQRRAALAGFVQGIFRASELLLEIYRKETQASVDLEVYDGEVMSRTNLLFDSDQHLSGVNDQPGNNYGRAFAATQRVKVVGRYWTLHFTSLPAFEQESEHYLPRIVLVGGTLVAFALFGIALAQAQARRMAERLSDDLRQARERDRLVDRATNDAIWDWDITTGKMAWNEATGAMFGYSPDKIRPDADWWKERVHADDRRRIFNGRESALQTGGEFWADEYRFHRGDNTYAEVIDRGYIIRDNQGLAIRMIGSIVDITGRKQAEEAHRKSEQKLMLHVRQTPLAVIEWNLDFEVAEWNPAAERIFGYTAAEAIGKRGLDLIFPTASHDQVERIWGELLAQTIRLHGRGDNAFAAGRRSVNENRTKEGRPIICDWYNTPLVDASGQVIGVASLALDVTERKKAEQALAAEKERLAVTLRSIADGVITTDTEDRVTLMNKVAEDLTGWKQAEAVGQPLPAVFHVVDQKTGAQHEDPVKQSLQTGQIVDLPRQTTLLSRQGQSQRLIASSAAPIRDKDSHIVGAVLVFRDVTDQQALELELLRAGKLESLAILAGGIAHDFNNILTAVTGNLSLAKMSATPGERIYARLEEAEKAALRARDLTMQLLTFAKGGAPLKQTTSIRDIIRDSAEFAMRGAAVRCEFAVAEDLWPADVDEGQISQVINNLAINATQALPEGGVVSVAAVNFHLQTGENLPLPPGKYVHISVKDQGIGIKPEHLPKIFDPYFTTKQKGSGLGLATSYSIIKKHDGIITVESVPGKGTTFHIYLPASDKTVTRAPSASAEPLRGRGRILVMDDDLLIRQLSEVALQDLGYEVETAPDGLAAVECYTRAKAQGRPFAAVIMDLTIPGGMGGKEAVRKLQAVDADVKAIVSSGYSNDPVMAQFAEYGFVGVVGKPYRVQDLAKVLSDVLNPAGK